MGKNGGSFCETKFLFHTWFSGGRKTFMEGHHQKLQGCRFKDGSKMHSACHRQVGCHRRLLFTDRYGSFSGRQQRLWKNQKLYGRQRRNLLSVTMYGRSWSFKGKHQQRPFGSWGLQDKTQQRIYLPLQFHKAAGSNFRADKKNLRTEAEFPVHWRWRKKQIIESTACKKWNRSLLFESKKLQRPQQLPAVIFKLSDGKQRIYKTDGRFEKWRWHTERNFWQSIGP